MPVVQVDEKGRITLPRRVEEELDITGQAVLLEPRSVSLVLERLEPRSAQATRTDPLFWLLAHPAHVGKNAIRIRPESVKPRETVAS
jgi:bifunctional DNA-binding transcriptional regulator/antitoxin component of YhaV-PrlF toxin-antitoxin module